MYESHHVSRHFEKRSKQTGKSSEKAARIKANQQRSRKARCLPKLSLAVQASSHLILAAVATTGMGADHAHFVPLLRQAKRRTGLDLALADAGYDSEANHVAARQDMHIRSLIPATAGRPGAVPPKGHYRRLMKRQLKTKRQRKKAAFGQRWQSETAHSMMKRNMGSACRAKTAWGRKKDMLLRSVTHNIMIITNL